MNLFEDYESVLLASSMTEFSGFLYSYKMNGGHIYQSPVERVLIMYCFTKTLVLSLFQHLRCEISHQLGRRKKYFFIRVCKSLPSRYV